jgi:hypothetical protein
VSTAQRRSSPRIAVEAKVVVVSRSGGSVEGHARNLSRGGLCVESAGAIEAGSDADVQIRLVFDAETTSEDLVLPARIVWCTPMGETNQVGLQFLALTDDQSAYLDMFLRYLEADEPADEEQDEGDEGDPFAA